MSHRLMSDEQVAEARRLRENGLTFRAIAERIGFHKQTVRYALIPLAGASRDRVREANRRETAVRNAIDKAARNRLLPPEQIAIALDLRQRVGMTYRAIAETLGDGATAHRVRVSIIAAMPAGQSLPPQIRMPESSADRAEWRLAKRQARKEAKRRQRELEYAMKETAREQDDRVADEKQRLRTGSAAPTEAEELRLLGPRLVAINRTAKSNQANGG